MKKGLFGTGVLFFLISGALIKVNYIIGLILLLISIILIWIYTKDIVKGDIKNAQNWVKENKSKNPKQILAQYTNKFKKQVKGENTNECNDD